MNNQDLKYKKRIYTSEQRKKWRLNYLTKNPWAKTMASQSTKSRPGNRYYERGIKNYLTLKDLKCLWFRDKAYNLKTPSIDRIDGLKHYTMENSRYIELLDNKCRKHSVICRIPRPWLWIKINQYDLKNKFIKTWNSLTQVEKTLGILKTSIHNCLSGKSKTAGGFIWKYAK